MKSIYKTQGAAFTTLRAAIKHAKKFQFSHITSNGDLIALVVKDISQGFSVHILPIARE